MPLGRRGSLCRWAPNRLAAPRAAQTCRRSAPPPLRGGTAAMRLGVGAAVGVLVGATVTSAGEWRYGLLLGWMAAAAVSLVWQWWVIVRMDAPTTAAHCLREDLGRKTLDLIHSRRQPRSCPSRPETAAASSSQRCGPPPRSIKGGLTTWNEAERRRSCGTSSATPSEWVEPSRPTYEARPRHDGSV